MSNKLIIQVDLDQTDIESTVKNTSKNYKEEFKDLSKSIEGQLNTTFMAISKNAYDSIVTPLTGGALKFSDILKNATGFIVGGAVLKVFDMILSSITAIGREVKSTVDDFAQQELAIAKLGQALRSTGSFTQEAITSFSDFASELQTVSAYSDDVVLSQLAIAKSMNATNDQAKDLVKAAANLASTFGVSLDEAVINLGQTLSGQIGRLGKFIPELKTLTDEQLKSGKAIDIINQKFANASENELKTYAGSLVKIKNSYSDLKEEIGAFIVDTFRLKEVNKALSDTFGFLAEKVALFRENSKRSNGTLVESEGSINRLSYRYAELTDQIESLQSRIKELVPEQKFSVRAAGEIVMLRDKIVVLNKEYEKIFKTINSFSVEASAPAKNITETTNTASANITALIDKLNELRERTKFIGMTDKEIILAQQEESLSILNQGYEAKLIAEQEFQSLKQKIIFDSGERIKEIEARSMQERKQILDQANKILRDAMARAISDGIQNIVRSLVNGENVLKNFGQFVLVTFADLAIQLGQFFIGFGIAFDAFKALGSGAAMVAAGAALVALGSIIKAFSDKGLKGSGSSGVASVGAQPSPGQLTTPTDLASPNAIDEERLKPQTNVQVVVQGSLVQQEELGDFITRTLNESFGKQGVTLTDARFV
jgi:predicted nuclease with TOPRIM domain